MAKKVYEKSFREFCADKWAEYWGMMKKYYSNHLEDDGKGKETIGVFVGKKNSFVLEKAERLYRELGDRLEKVSLGFYSYRTSASIENCFNDGDMIYEVKTMYQANGNLFLRVSRFDKKKANEIRNNSIKAYAEERIARCNETIEKARIAIEIVEKTIALGESSNETLEKIISDQKETIKDCEEQIKVEQERINSLYI